MNFRRFSLMLIAVVAMAMMTTTAFADDRDDQNDPTGVWLLNLAFNGGPNAAAAQIASGPNTLAPFNTVLTFHADGTYEYSAVFQYTPIALTPGHGLWEKAGKRDLSLTCFGMVLGNLAAPQLLGTYNDQTNITLNKKGDQMTATFVVRVYDPLGNLVQTLSGGGTGRRATQ